ncbi:cytochrome c oxidase assembly factor Coa1 family protein [Psychroserpens luteolus]|uniref:cytochrome c oxidase assembly factor Coa1 family protein n=1 Tax=Psychroserpens luteolus TaxID=2855840 RepID=UPI001E3DFBCB|nr:cytochrome c oxidase assembly factor Coa1 family protein [Psychroserpens luteolus]MCD2258013.1 cytochrome c oxidase assembly factor 1 family protein [Psychroserpens luteolus]
MEHVRQKSWFGRNWLWVLPVGGCLGVILLFVFGIGAAIFGVSKIIKESEPYEYAVEAAKSNSDVQLALGEAIDTDGLFQGNMTLNNSTGEADIRIPIKGENGKGTIVVLAEKNGDDWTYEKLYVIIKQTQEEINLLEKSMEGD